MDKIINLEDFKVNKEMEGFNQFEEYIDSVIEHNLKYITTKLFEGFEDREQLSYLKVLKIGNN
ncbi:hypothetical protein [Heyndrickxia oleronia]|jgi:hypothetical protein|uniref:hypothetical protein n=1 Tax=Heyndrickxia oleronia TaxID=38875 RepID=UPI0024325D27|nr:hypothetical protein [Heyndrickxia oleronia]MCI1590400.1 hypothetical protein [Heyndrickxia oleronia]MCI1611338.1 hypothetical protein [Heyndrickxia oleronia]MCI1742781.1 hypothetical protein [Heyndrickxia oleronia]MCI1763134.1 hypothetical protein [Heyndrickxia oleronia]